MEIRFNFRNFAASDHLKSYSESRLQKIGKYIADDTLLVTIHMEVDKYRHKAEVVVSGADLHLTAAEESEDMYASIDLVWAKLEAQVRKNSEKSKGRRKGQKYPSVRMETYHIASEASLERKRRIVSSDRFEPKPMMIEEAALQLEKSKDEFLVFFNAETERINVMYPRKNGEFAVIDPGEEF